MKKEKDIIYQNITGVSVKIKDGNTFVVKHGNKEMCPTTDKTLAIIYAKGYERGLAEGKKLAE